jgi:Cdc6-like AAA superfamily ATPase
VPQSVVVQTNTGKNRFSAKSSKVSGKLTTIKTKGVEITGDVESITVVGKEDPTRAQTEKRNIIMDALLGGKILLGNFLVRSVWLDESVFCQPMPAHSRRGVTIPLNPSQSLAVDCMLGDASVDYPNFVLVQGPPGTGKTATIAAVVQGVTEDEKGGLWLIAHSNVAVKNIGEKLASIGFFDWKLLVSTNFHFDW